MVHGECIAELKKIISPMMNLKLQHLKFTGLFVFLWLFFGGCQENKRGDLDTVDTGTIHISVDESFKPVIDSEIMVFEALHPKAKIIAEYKSEADCFKDLQKDSTRMIIVTRGLSPEEEKFFEQKLSFLPSFTKVANDAVAVIVNNESADSIFLMSELRGILSGTTGDKEKAVFDGLSGASIARFAKDSILEGKPFNPEKVFAVKSSQDVIDYVSKNKNVVGFIGVSWIGNPEDSAQLSFLNKVKIASVECSCPEKTFVKPYQANIMTKRYPLVRGLYYILKENYEGLGSGFANFLTYEKGQLIFRRAYLGPAKINFSIRTATIR
jgi:phosphate transport system substrate-binding protein